MKILSLNFENVKGRSASHKLTPLTMFVGNNGAGKSSRMDVIRLALNGYVPNVGARNDAIFKLSSGSVMKFAVEFDCGIITGRWERKADSISGSRRVPAGFPELPAVLFDPKTYFSLSSEKRIQFAFDAMNISKGAFDTADLLAKLKLIKCEEHSAAHQAVLDEIVKAMSDSAAKQKRTDGSIQEWIGKEIAEMQERVKLVRASCDRMAKTAAGMVELEASKGQAEQNMGKIDDEFDVITSQLADAVEELRKQTDIYESIAGAVKRKEELQKKLEGLGDIPLRIRTTQAEIDRLKKIVDGFKSNSSQASAALVEAQGNVSSAEAQKIAAEKNLNLVLQGQEQERQKQAKRDQAKTDLAAVLDQSQTILELESGIRRAADEVTNYKSETGDFREKLHELENQRSLASEKQAQARRQSEDTERELSRFRQLEECPTCFHKGDTWKVPAIEKLEEKFTAFSSEIEVYNKQLKESEGTRNKLSDKMLESAAEDRRIEELNRTIEPMRVKLAKATHLQASRKQTMTIIETLGEPVDLSKAVTQAESELTRAKANLQMQSKTRETCDAIYEDALKADSKHLETVARLSFGNTHLASLQSDSSESARLTETIASVELADPKAVQRQVIQAKSKVDELKKKQEENRTAAKQCAASLQTLAIREQSVDERVKIEAEMVVRKLALAELQAFRSAMVDTAFKPLLSLANSMVGKFLPSPLEYRNDEIGMVRGDSWATDLTFSGAEQAYTFVALAVSLARSSPFKIILMDMMGEVDNTPALLKHMSLLIRERVIDQFIGCDRNLDRYDNVEVDGLSLIRL